MLTDGVLADDGHRCVGHGRMTSPTPFSFERTPIKQISDPCPKVYLLTETLHQLPNGVAKPWIESIQEANSESLIIDLSAYVYPWVLPYFCTSSPEFQDISRARIPNPTVRNCSSTRALATRKKY